MTEATTRKRISIAVTSKDTTSGKFGFKLNIDPTDPNVTNVLVSVSGPAKTSDSIARTTQIVLDRIVADYYERDARKEKIDAVVGAIPGQVSEFADNVTAGAKKVIGSIAELFK